MAKNYRKNDKIVPSFALKIQVELTTVAVVIIKT